MISTDPLIYAEYLTQQLLMTYPAPTITGDNNTQKMMTSNETQITVAISDLIISEGLSFNLFQKPRFKKVLESARTVSKCYQPTNRNLISKDLLDVIHYQNLESNLILIE